MSILFFCKVIFYLGLLCPLYLLTRLAIFVHENYTAMPTFGERLKKLREERRVSQSELARRLDTSPRMVLRWEKDEVKPGADHLVNISKNLGVSVDEILGLGSPDDPLFHELMALTSHLDTKNRHLVLDLVRALANPT